MEDDSPNVLKSNYLEHLRFVFHCPENVSPLWVCETEFFELYGNLTVKVEDGFEAAEY